MNANVKEKDIGVHWRPSAVYFDTKQFLICLLLIVLSFSEVYGYDWSTYNVEDFEESAGAIGCVEFNPADNIYGVSVGDGTWLTGTPVFGDFFLPVFYNGIEEALYAGMGMTLRIMPHWKLAPFAGGGASYNLSLTGTDDSEFAEIPLGESYWGGHTEGGIRVQTAKGFYEIMGRFTWSSSEVEDSDYWTVRLGWGGGL